MNANLNLSAPLPYSVVSCDDDVVIIVVSVVISPLPPTIFFVVTFLETFLTPAADILNCGLNSGFNSERGKKIQTSFSGENKTFVLFFLFSLLGAAKMKVARLTIN